MQNVTPQSEWEWFGTPGHHIMAFWCRFHLTTKVGEYLVSTVGELVHPVNLEGGQDALRWQRKNWPGAEVGCGRYYETMVFHTSSLCEADLCGQCGMPNHNGHGLDMLGYQTAAEANRGHMAMCRKYAGLAQKEPRPAD
jgi:hypothetical protein